MSGSEGKQEEKMEKPGYGRDGIYRVLRPPLSEQSARVLLMSSLVNAKKKSMVWEHFTVSAVNADFVRAFCNQCKKSFAYISGSKQAGTSHLKRDIALGICPVFRSSRDNDQLGPSAPSPRSIISINGTNRPRKRHRAGGHISFSIDFWTSNQNLLGNHGGSGSRLPARQRKNKIWPGDDQYDSINIQSMTFIGCFDDYLAGNSCLAPTSFSRKPALHDRRR
ncbi:zinc finger BED domain-containing protein DAYSLEEPER-like [Dorcoceras hygrometricum]|uniref:Zinc finger BED domain-containing protein DAYSLEEPER-like n=1 Tax=Dorcoceras hygrometricum TaxID=472368 RepID=A0A2Z7BZ54_9LAMI|nr:zinc finger BED domain-containing protein DAYSLEEPER-like [Dorcoceras hygrometricum]